METGQKTLAYHVLVFGVTVVGEGLDGDAAAGVEQADDLQVLGIHQLDQVLHDDVYAILMEVAVVAEAEKVKLEALALHHQRTRDVINDEVPEIGLASLGAQRGKLRTIQRHQVFIL